MFRLVNAEVRPLTRAFAEEFAKLDASPTERELNERRVKHLREKADAGQLVTFNWSVATLGDKRMRMNGQHSSAMLCGLNGTFPEGLKVHLDEYEVDSKDDLAVLFRQFDDRKSGRTPGDVAGAFQGLYDDLHDVPRDTAKIGAEGIAWYRRNVEGLPVETGDGQYALFGEKVTHAFLRWLGVLFTVKTPELKRHAIVAAIYGTFAKNEGDARAFWEEVARGGKQYDGDNEPTTILDAWLKSLVENRRSKPELKPAQYYQACIYAWNAAREGKTLQAIKYDAKKGLHSIRE